MDEFLDGLERFVSVPVYGKIFGAKVFKIARDDQGNRLTYMKITGGSLQVKAVLTNAGKAGEKEVWEEKVNQIRIYSGDKYELVNEVQAGSVCAVTGLNHTHPGEGLGAEAASAAPRTGAGAHLFHPFAAGVPGSGDAPQAAPAGRGGAGASYCMG